MRELDIITPDARPVQNGRSGKVALRLNARSLLSEDGASIGRYELIRPGRRDYLGRDQYDESNWASIKRAAFEAAWTAEAEEIGAAHGCFTDIIRYQTRLFVPIDRAAEVLTRIAA